MTGKSGSSGPAPPDPAALATTQGALNLEAARETARLNRIQEVTPFGTSLFHATGNPTAPFQRTMTLDPAEQAQLEAERGLNLDLTNLGADVLDRISPQIATPFTLDGLPPAPVANEAVRDEVSEALLARLNPQFDRDRGQLETQLANQGFSTGSEGFTEAMDEIRRAQTDARFQAVLAGGGEQSRLFGIESAARERAVQEAVLQRAQPINEIASLLGTAGPVNVPQFSGTAQVGVGAPDFIGSSLANFQGQLANQQRQDQFRSANLGGLFGLGGSLISGFL